MFSDEEILEAIGAAVRSADAGGNRLCISTAAARAIMTKAVELAAAHGETMTAEQISVAIKELRDTAYNAPWTEEIRADDMDRLDAIEQHISTLGARNAVLEAEREDYRNKMELAQEGEAERDRAMHEAQDEVEKLRERLAAAEESSRELVRRAQQAEALLERERKQHAETREMHHQMCMVSVEHQKRADAAEARCATLSAAGQVLSAHVDQYAIPNALYTCSPTCTHDDAATPGHPERVKERSEAMWKIVAPDAPSDSSAAACEGDASWTAGFEFGKEQGAESMRAACWEAVQRVGQTLALGPTEMEMLKAAIKRAAS